MTNANKPHDAEPKIPVPSRRQWAKPELIQYGHLAKLTRGPSGKYIEATGMSPKMSCL